MTDSMTKYKLTKLERLWKSGMSVVLLLWNSGAGFRLSYIKNGWFTSLVFSEPLKLSTRMLSRYVRFLVTLPLKSTFNWNSIQWKCLGALFSQKLSVMDNKREQQQLICSQFWTSYTWEKWLQILVLWSQNYWHRSNEISKWKPWWGTGIRSDWEWAFILGNANL